MIADPQRIKTIKSILNTKSIKPIKYKGKTYFFLY